MPPYAAFHLGIHRLPKYLLTSIRNEKGQLSLGVSIVAKSTVNIMAERKFNLTPSYSDEFDYNNSFTTEEVTYASSTRMWETFETQYYWDTWAVVYLIIGIIGTVANLILLVLLLKTKEKTTSFTVIVGSMAISDMLFLTVYLVYDWAYYTLNYDVILTNIFGCKTMHALWISTLYMDSFLVIDLIIERVTNAYFPLLIKLFSRRNTGLVAVSCSVIAAFIFNVHYMIRVEYVSYQLPNDNTTFYYCGVYDEEYFYYQYLTSYTILFFVVFLPSMVILVGNVFLIKALCKSANVSVHQQNREKRDKIVYVIMIGTMFLLLNIPYIVYATEFIRVEQLHEDIAITMRLLYHSLKCLIFILYKRSFKMCCF